MMTQEAKERARQVMTVDYMSSEESTVSSEDEIEAGDGRKLVCRTLPWRSEEATGLMQALDRKYLRRQTPQGQQMTCERVEGKRSSRPQPATIPEWALEDFIL